jgi:periplasmic protein CpxP/Spy
MYSKTKNKLLLWLVILLLAGNTASIAVFWLGKNKQPAAAKGTPKEFLIKELQLNSRQQEELELLMVKHREEAPGLRKEIRQAKKDFFDLLKQQNIADSSLQAAAKNVSLSIEQLDLFTFTHFKKIRELCTPEQQDKFDSIIEQVTTMMPPPRRFQGPDGDPRKTENTPPQ